MGNEGIPNEKREQESCPQPDVSIIITCYNGGELVRKTLGAILAQQTSRSFEILVIDSGSGPQTLGILGEFPIHLVRIPHEEFNHGLTRDMGARMAKGEVLIFLNQDAEPGTEKWLDLMVAPFGQSKEVLAVQGRVHERPDQPGFFWNSCDRGFSYTCETRRWTRHYHNIGFSTVNCAVRRSVWKREPFGSMDILEDKAFQAKIHLKGDEIVFSDGWVYHSHDFTYTQLKKRIQDEGFGWRLVGVSYSLCQMVKDLFRLKKYVELWKGLMQGKVRSGSEMLFPVVRPLWLCKGNHWNRGLLKE